MLVVGNGPSRRTVFISSKLLIQAEVKLRILHQDLYIHSSISKAARFLIGAYLKHKLQSYYAQNMACFQGRLLLPTFVSFFSYNVTTKH